MRHDGSSDLCSDGTESLPSTPRFATTHLSKRPRPGPTVVCSPDSDRSRRSGAATRRRTSHLPSSEPTQAGTDTIHRLLRSRGGGTVGSTATANLHRVPALQTGLHPRYKHRLRINHFFRHALPPLGINLAYCQDGLEWTFHGGDALWST